MKKSFAGMMRAAAALTFIVLIGPLIAPDRAPAEAAARPAHSSQTPPRAALAALHRWYSLQAQPAGVSPGKSRNHPRTFAGFTQIAAGGFNDSENSYAWAMAWFKGRLYVGTSRNNLCNAAIIRKSIWTKRVTGCPNPQDYLNLDMRAEIWAYTPGSNSWQMVFRSPMVDDTVNGHLVRIARDVGYRSMAVYTDRHGVTALYVGTTGFGRQAFILQTIDGVNFQTLGPAGLGVYADSIRALTAYDGRLFVAPIGGNAAYMSGLNRDKVYMTDDPASGKWTAASTTGFGDVGNSQLYTMGVFNGQLYAAMSNGAGYQIWRTNAQGRPPYQWTAVVINGGYRGYTSPTVTTMAVFHNKLYVGSSTETTGPVGSRGKPSEIIAINPDDSWDLIMGDARQTPEGYKRPLSGYGPGFNNRYNVYLWDMAVHDGWLYAGTYDYSTFIIPTYPVIGRRDAGFDLYRTRDGIHWQPVSTQGFGNPYNYGVRTMMDTPAGFFLGTANPFANAPDHQGGAEIWLMPSRDGLSRPHDVSLSPAPCPMAHCDPQLQGSENISIPTNSVSVAWSYRDPRLGFLTALGCSSGAAIIVCAGTAHNGNIFTGSYVRAFDFQGHNLWDSRNILNAFVAGGVPFIDDQDNSYVGDTNTLVSFSPEGVVRWQTPNPTQAVIVSMNMVSSGWLVGQAGLSSSGRGLLMVINPQTGVIADKLDLADTLNGAPGEWGTPKTISVVGNRLYTVTQFVPFSKYAVDAQHHSRLYAIDVDARGHLHVAWHWDYEGPTGSSPMAIPGAHPTIYFGGTGLNPGDPQHVMLFAVRDMGSYAQKLWANDLTQVYGVPYPTSSTSGIQTAAALDPRGGVWVWTTHDRHLFRFDQNSGQVLGELDMAQLTGDPGATPDGAINIATNGGKPVLITGVLGGAGHPNGVAAIDLTSGSLLWTAPLDSGTTAAPYGQFPLVPLPDGSALLVAPTYDGVVHGFALH